LLTLFPTILLVCGKVNFTNLSRYSDLCEKSYRRHYGQSFAFVQLNQHTIAQAIAPTSDSIAAIDCSFIAKSGKATYGLDWFYNGSASRSEKGLEISVIAVIDVSARRGYTLSVQQTPPTPTSTQQQSQRKGKGKTQATPTVSRQAIEQIRSRAQSTSRPAQSDPTINPSLRTRNHPG